MLVVKKLVLLVLLLVAVVVVVMVLLVAVVVVVVVMLIPGSYSYLSRHVEHPEPHHPEQPSWFHIDRTHKLLQPCDHRVTHLHEKSHFQKERLSLVGHIWEAFQLHEYNSVIEFRVRTDLDVQLKWALLALRQFFGN